MGRFTIVFFLSALAVGAQQIGQNAPTSWRQYPGHILHQQPAGDRNGKCEGQERQGCRGLTAKDFTVTEDGAEQTIRFFEFPEGTRGG